jgi:spermidine synthase
MFYQVRFLLLAIFTLSGFTGLIYESIWSHYLKLFLGHAAYAQAMVLAIFMGGMAIGAWLTTRLLPKWTNLLILYAVIEGIIGLLGISFHQIFEQTLSISFDHVIPSLNSPVTIHLYKWMTGALLILPQSILLGMTFPLMSNALIRLFPITPGATLAILYFCNSIGAAIGVLVSGFYLIQKAGLPGTILAAGILNIGLAIIAYKIAKTHKPKKVFHKKISEPTNLPKFFLVAAFITGVASFIYELIWLRMLSMVLGASTHSFELMLSAFITGLAFGGLWIYRRIDSFESPIRVGGYIQILMGIFALLTIPLYNSTFDLMSFFLAALDSTEAGYQLFTFTNHFIALLVMLPATFCAGMTLPLFTFILLKLDYGEKSIGYTYASNTLGAILGVILTIFIGLPYLGLKNSILFGSSLDIILGISLIVLSRPTLNFKVIATPLLLLVPIITLITMTNSFDIRRMASGVYRTGETTIPEGNQVLFHKDGKTASISVFKDADNVISIATNGKPDASINMDNNVILAQDEVTQILLAIIPLSIYPEAKNVANIGMGSGLTTHTLLASPNIEHVDTIEIESAVIEGAKIFKPRVNRAYYDARSHIHIEDAKTFFSTQNKQYDLIISEPSNPWVSGVSSLFTEEFYERMTQYLSTDGMLVQWLHLYEINTPLIFSVIKALNKHFTNFAIYSTDDINFILIAKNGSPIKQAKEDIFYHSSVLTELKSININNVHDIHARYIGNNEMLSTLIKNSLITANSDFFPILDLYAPKARFLGQSGKEFIAFKKAPLPLTKFLSPAYMSIDSERVNAQAFYSFSNEIIAAKKLVDYTKKKNINLTTLGIENLKSLITLSETCEAHLHPKAWIDDFYELTIRTLPYLQDIQLNLILNAITPDCINDISEQQAAWIALYKSFINSDAESMNKYSEILFNDSENLSSSQGQFLFSTRMLSLVLLQDSQAKSFWNKNITVFPDSSNIPMWLTMLFALSQGEYKS